MIFYISCRVASLYAVYYSFVTGEGRVPWCRRGCSPVSKGVFPGAEPLAPRCRRNAPLRRCLGWGDGRMAGLPAGCICFATNLFRNPDMS